MSEQTRTNPSGTRRPAAVAVRLPDDRATFTGTPAEVGAMLAAAARTGRLAAWSSPVPTGVPGEVLVNCRLLPPQRVTVRPVERPLRRRVPRWAWYAGGGFALAVLSAVGWVVYELVTYVAAHGRQMVAVLIVLGLVVLIVLAKGGGRGCTVLITHIRR